MHPSEPPGPTTTGPATTGPTTTDPTTTGPATSGATTTPGATTPPPVEPGRRRRWWRYAFGTVAGLVVVVAVAAAFVRLPYVLISPGTATPVEDVVQIEGATTYEHDGSVLFLTVNVSSERPNVYGALGGWLDDDVDVLPEEDVFPDRNREEERERNRVAMTASQVTATKVALERLGYPVPVEQYVVFGIEPDSPAEGVLELGDEITAVDGVAVTMVPDLGATVRTREPGEPVVFDVTRDDESLTLTVPTRPTPDGPTEGQAQVGIYSSPEYHFPVDVTIDTGDVGGPSAGLAFTLTILEELSPGGLTGDQEVAVTGTIEDDGAVGEVGGVEQKAAAARRAGARLFLVPEPEAAEARRYADGMKVVAVNDLDEALAALERNGGDPLVPVDVPAA
ncbi:MAG TPA: PDZ domain-containing protein [Acidimicrobiia bacterium]